MSYLVLETMQEIFFNKSLIWCLSCTPWKKMRFSNKFEYIKPQTFQRENKKYEL